MKIIEFKNIVFNCDQVVAIAKRERKAFFSKTLYFIGIKTVGGSLDIEYDSESIRDEKFQELTDFMDKDE